MVLQGLCYAFLLDVFNKREGGGICSVGEKKQSTHSPSVL